MGKNMIRRIILAGLIFGNIQTMEGITLKKSEREFTVSTARLEATIKDARIINLKNRKTGENLADRLLAEPSKTSGLGCMLGKEKELSRLHFPWGEVSMDQHRKVAETSLYHHPDKRSKLSISQNGSQVKAIWEGLTDGSKFYPKEKITLTLGEDSNGALTIQSHGKSPGGGVFGMQVPLENISSKGTFILPVFGGMEYSAKGCPALMTFQNTVQFYEAPVMTYEIGNCAIGLWSEDSSFRPFFAFLQRNKKSCSFALEFANIMPYEPLKKINPPTLKLDIFNDSQWVGAARPYRDWYHKTFAREIAKRDSIEWANDICAIVDAGPRSTKALKQVANIMPPEAVMFHVWQARKEGFTTNVPDYTPKKNYPVEVKRMHDYRFKVMCYTCALCAVYKCPVWKHDKLSDFFLTRKDSITNYHGGESAFDDNLVGNITKSDSKNQFKLLKAGAFLYGDPLSPGWRDYYPKVIKTFNMITGTDANYQDTLGCTADVGNGIVNGLSAAQGNAALTRALQDTMPNTPMASEFGPNAIAFGVKWPLNYAQVWGGQRFRESRIHRQHPLTPFLFSYRTWIPVVNAGDDFKKHLIAACSDALSGMGMFASSENLQAENGFDGHLVLRSKVFSENGLKPYYPERRYQKNIRAMYKSKSGKIFKYYDDGHLQIMLDPAGKALYGRINRAERLNNNQLTLPGWPVRDAKGIGGLDPSKNYALFPVKKSNIPELTVNSLPDGVSLGIYYATPDFAYLEFRQGKKGPVSATIRIKSPAYYRKGYVNNKIVRTGVEMKISGSLPLRLFLTTGKKTTPDTVRNINLVNGLQSGNNEALPRLRRYIDGREFLHLNYYNVKSLDYVLPVKDKKVALEFYLKNTQNKYGNGSIVRLLINGKEIKSFDCMKQNPKWSKKNKKVKKNLYDTKLRCWLIPLGKFAGQEVLVTIQVDNKSSNNADMQWITLPKLVKDSKQVFSEKILNADFAAPGVKSSKRPSGKVTATINPDWKSSQFIKANGVSTYVPTTKHGFVTTVTKIKIEADKIYYLSGEFKKDKADKNTFFMGVVQYGAKGRKITGININALAGSDTQLSHAAKAGSEKITVMDASKWRLGGMVALNSDPSKSDLPNYQLVGPVTKITKTGGDWEVILKNPLKQALESDNNVRMHMPAGTYTYLSVSKLSTKFKKLGGTIKWWPGAKSFKILLLSPAPIQFKDFKLEILSQ